MSPIPVSSMPPTRSRRGCGVTSSASRAARAAARSPLGARQGDGFELRGRDPDRRGRARRGLQSGGRRRGDGGDQVHVRRFGGRRTRPHRRAGGGVRPRQQRTGEHCVSATGRSNRLARSTLTAIGGGNDGRRTSRTDMSLSELIKPDAVLPALRVNGKKQALQEMSERAAAVSGAAGARDFRRAASAGAARLDRRRRRRRHPAWQALQMRADLRRLRPARTRHRLRSPGWPSGRPDLHADRPGIRGRRSSQGAGFDRAPAAETPRPPRSCARPATRPRSMRCSRWRRRRTPPERIGDRS